MSEQFCPALIRVCSGSLQVLDAMLSASSSRKPMFPQNPDMIHKNLSPAPESRSPKLYIPSLTLFFGEWCRRPRLQEAVRVVAKASVSGSSNSTSCSRSDRNPFGGGGGGCTLYFLGFLEPPLVLRSLTAQSLGRRDADAGR